MEKWTAMLSGDVPKIAALTLSLGLLLSGTAYAGGPPPVITVQPLSQAVLLNTSVTFAVVVSSSTTLSYQWRKNGANISGATLSTYSIPAVLQSHAADYSVKVVNGGGTVYSSNATLTVLVPAGIATQPQSKVVVQNQNTSFSVVASGTVPLSYQWSFNGISLLDATNATLALTNVQTNDAGNYTVLVANPYGSATSAVATLTVLVPPAITTQPQSQTVIQGQSAPFSIEASGTAPLSYSWRLNGTILAGGTNASLALSNVQSNQAGGYTMVVTNAAGSVTSVVATLVVLVPAGIATQPQSKAVTQGQNAAFSVVPGGTAPISYQWSFNGTDVPGATNASLALTNVQTTDDGSYTVLVTNSWGSTTSTVATLTVYVPAAITTQPQSQTVIQGQPGSFSVVATGIPLPSYQWRFNGFNLSGSTNSTLTSSNVQTNYAGNYTVVVTNVAGSVTSVVATLTVLVPAGITTQPVSKVVVQNQNTSFTVVPSGTATFSYQWNFNGTLLLDSTNSTLSLTNVQTGDAGSYTVVVANSWGSVTSAVATLTVLVPPGITTQPQSQTAVQGQSPSFFVEATGTAPLMYFWRLNGANVIGGTNALLMLSNVQSNQSGNYTVVVTNSAGSITSAVATLTIFVPAGIATQPLSKAVIQNQNTSFSVVPSGTAPFSYQWNFEGTPLLDSTNSTLALTNVQTNDAGSYTVVVKNSWGSVTSTVATLTVYVPPSITTQPLSQTITQGDTVSFFVEASGSSPFTYQWYLNGLATGAAAGKKQTFTLLNVSASKAGNYTVVVTNPGGSVTSVMATLTVLVPPAITTQPVSQTVTQGMNVSFSIGASGTAPLSYQWRFNGTPLTGTTNSILTLNNTQTNQAGSYTVVVTNVAGSVTSAVATLTVLVPAGIGTEPQSQTVIQGQSASFSVMASGTAPLSYQWRFNGTNLARATNATVTFANVRTNSAGSYTVVVTNVAGSVTSAVATLTVYVPPTITTQPQSQTLIQGQNASFSVEPSGTAPFSYQWSLDGTAVSGATNVSLALTNVQMNDAGSYTVGVTNAAGSVTSVVATLTVYIPPTISTEPASQAVMVGHDAAFTVMPSGTAPFRYQWNFNGVALSGATNASLAFTNVQKTFAGNYSVIVANLVGSISSIEAALLVTIPPSTLSISDPSALSPAGFSFQFSVSIGSTYVIEAATNFKDWTPIATNVANTSIVAFTDADAGNYAARFYRLVVR